MKSCRPNRNEYGQTYRTNFELAQNGTSARLLDEIHYYTSCVLNKGSAVCIKGDALEALIDIYACNFDQHTGSMLMSSLGSVMDVLCESMAHDHETELIHKSLVLLMALCSNHEGSFIEAIILPDAIVEYLLFGSISVPGSRRASANDCEVEMDGSTRGLMENSAGAAAIAPKYHRKRKYISTKTLSESSLTAPDVEERGTKTAVTSMTDPPPREHRSVAASTGLYSFRHHFSALYEAFWRCSSCIAKNSSSDDHLLAETDFLRLLLLNRYIATKIHCLTSIQTSYFSSDSRERVVEEESANDTATSRYYRRQSDCVAALQRKMSMADPRRQGGSQTYLRSLFLQLQRETSGAMSDRPPDLGSCPCLSRCCRGTVWLMMGVLEAACFRCPSNQRLIASRGLSPGAVDAPTPSCIGLLTSILVSSTPRWTSIDRSASFNEPTVDLTAIVRPHSIATQTVDPPDRSPHRAVLSVSPSLARPSGPSSAGMIGERGRRALQAKRAANLFAELPQQSSEPSPGKDCVPDAPDAAAPPTTLLVVIGLQEVQIAALRSLISISNNCEEACTAALHEPGLLTWSVAMLAWCAAWRCVLSTGSSSAITGQPVGALTLNETPLERFVFDVTLYLQSLLTNILEHDQTTISQSINVLDCLKECPSVKTVFHPGVRSIPVALSGRLPLIQKVLDLPTAGRRSPCYSMSDECSSSLTELLIEIVLLETADFIEDINRTDEAMNQPREVGAEGLSRRVSDASTSSPLSSQKSSDRDKRESDALPVAALILSSYASLLLHTVVSACPSRSAMECVRSRLPRGTWWLCIRVLKAFLALQGQTGVVLLENIGPVVQTLRRMGEQSAGLVGQVTEEMSYSAGARHEMSLLPPSISIVNSGHGSEEEPAVDYGQHHIAEENWLDDWRQLSHDTVTCTRRSMSHDEMKRSSEAVEEEGKWVWNGGDFVWICGGSDGSTNTKKVAAPKCVQGVFAVASIEDIVTSIDADGASTSHAPETLGDDLVIIRRRKRMTRL